MEFNCQRCREPLREVDRYCPVCGMPQLTYVAAEAQVIAGYEGAADLARVAPAELAALGDGILWQPALKAALILAVPTGLLCLGLFPIGFLGMAGAAAWAVVLYAKRSRPARLTMGTGARIGMLTGLIAGWLMVSVYGAQLWVSRFIFHQGSQWDSQWQSQVERTFDSSRMAAQMGSSVESAQMANWLRALMLSTEGRAGWVMLGLVLLAVFLVFFATVGGAVGARFLVPQRRPNV